MKRMELNVLQANQETPYSCVPACLQQLFDYYHKQISQAEILCSLDRPERGMSIPRAGLFLQESGLDPLFITNNINIFDPAWFRLGNVMLIKNLKKRRKFLDKYSQSLVDDYLKYLNNGGKIRFKTISPDLLVQYLSKGIPIMAELASTFIYKKSKSTKPGKFDDGIKGDIEGHCVIISGFDINKHKFKIVDPDSKNNPFSKKGIYWVKEEDLIASIFSLEGKSLLLVERK